MAKYTIIKPDNAIYIDRVAINDCDMSGSLEFHAMQYDSETGNGHLEPSDNSGNIELSTENDIETYTGLSLTEWINRRNQAIEDSTNLPSPENG